MKFPRFLNLSAIETALRQDYLVSLKSTTFEFDLSLVQWASPLSVATLSVWLSVLRNKSVACKFIAPQSQTQAASLLLTTQFQQFVLDLDFELEPSREDSANLDSQDLRCFEHFDSQASLEAYLSHLDNPAVQRELLNTTQPPPVVTTGDFHRVAVRELVRNALTHSGSSSAFLCALETKVPRPDRRPHPIFSSFGGDPYIELAVADFGLTNIEVNLRDTASRTSNLQPFRPYLDQQLDARERTLLLAFAFSSTSRPDLRRAQIARLVGGDELDPQLVATGLFDVACVAASFGGQIIVRSAGRLITLDFTDYPPSSIGPRVAYWRASKQGVRALPGSIIALRIPHRRQKLVTRPSEQLLLGPQRDTARSMVAISAHASAGEDVDTLLALEQELTGELEKKASVGSIISIFLDAPAPESKWTSALLQVLARLPRRNWGIIIVTDSAGYLQLAEATWARYSVSTKLEALRRPPSFLVFGPDDTCIVWGDPYHPEATALSKQGLIRVGGRDVIEIALALHQARTSLLSLILRSREILYKAEHWFLIEGRYYTQRYYAVNRITHQPRWQRAAEAWLQSSLGTLKPRAIIVLNSWLADLVRNINLRDTVISDAEQRGLMGAMLDVRAGDPGQIVILADLVCTGRSVATLLERSPRGSDFLLLTLVDGRTEALEYFAVNREDGPVTARVIAALRDKIPRRESYPPMKRVWVVDPVSGLPVPPDPHSPTRLNPLEALERFGAAGAIAAGHISDGRRHYLYFLNLPSAIECLSDEIEAWLLAKGKVLVADPQAKSGLTLLTVDEPKILLAQAERVARQLGIRSLATIPAEEIRRGVRPPFRRGSILWVVLPITTSGETCWRALHLAARLGSSRVHVSSIIGRSASPTLALFAGLTEYRGVPAGISHLLQLPLASFAPFDCPGCARRGSYAALYKEIRPRYPNLAEAVRDAQLEFEIRDQLLAETVGGQTPDISFLAALEARCQALVALGQRSTEARRTLEKTLAEPGGVRALLRYVARGLAPGSENRKELERVLYDTQVYEKAVQRFLGSRAKTGEVGHLELQGAAALWPEAVRSALPLLYAAREERPEVERALTAMTALDTEQYASFLPPLTQEDGGFGGRSLASELHDFAARGGLRFGSEAPCIVNEIVAHLTRSSGWTTPLLTLAMQLRYDEASDTVLQEIRKFLADGFAPLQSRMRTLLHESIWARVRQLNQAMKSSWERVLEAVGHLEAQTQGLALSPPPDWRVTLASQISQVEETAKTLLKGFETLRTRPIDAISEAAELAGIPDKFHLSVRGVESAGNIVIAHPDFLESALHVLENARGALVELQKPITIEISFRPVGLTRLAIDFLQAAPWRPPKHLEGGLGRLREILAWYGASYEVDDLSDSAALRTTLVFWRWQEK